MSAGSNPLYTGENTSFRLLYATMPKIYPLLGIRGQRPVDHHTYIDRGLLFTERAAIVADCADLVFIHAQALQRCKDVCH